MQSKVNITMEHDSLESDPYFFLKFRMQQFFIHFIDFFSIIHITIQ